MAVNFDQFCMRLLPKKLFDSRRIHFPRVSNRTELVVVGHESKSCFTEYAMVTFQYLAECTTETAQRFPFCAVQMQIFKLVND